MTNECEKAALFVRGVGKTYDDHTTSSHAAKHSLPRLRQLIEGLAPEKRPALVRGDNAFGNEGVMAEMEEINQRYLFKLRQTSGINA